MAETSIASSALHGPIGWLLRAKPLRSLADHLDALLLKARKAEPGDVYLCRALLMSTLSAFAAFALFAVLDLVAGVVLPGILSTPLAPSALAFAVTLCTYLVSPYLLVFSRKSNIDINLHHACTFLYGVTKSGVSLKEALRSLYEHRHIYGAAAEELGIAVKRSEYFGESIYRSLAYVAKTTCSPKLRDFIQEMISSAEETIGVGEFFRRKFDEYFAVAEETQKSLVRTLGVFGEVAVIFSALAPTAVLTAGVSLGVLAPSLIDWCRIYLFIATPVLIVMLLAYVKLAHPSEKMCRVERVVKPLPTPAAESAFEKELDKKERWLVFKDVLKSPIKLFFLYPWLPASAGVSAVAAFLFLAYLGGASAVGLMAFSALGVCAVFAVCYEVRAWYVSSIEKSLPGFLRNLAESVEKKAALSKAFEAVLRGRLGLLAKEVRALEAHRYGLPLRRVLSMIQYTTASPVLRRAINLLVKASEATRNLKDVLAMSAMDAEAYLNLKRSRMLTSIGYVASIYVAYGVFVYTLHILRSISAVLSSLSEYITIVAIPLDQLHILAVAMAVLLGLLAGGISSGNVSSGFKHSVVLLLIFILMLGVW